MLEITDLNKTFKRRQGSQYNVHAAKNVSLFIPEKSVTGLVGESGCGKSTLSRIIVGLEKADSGFVTYKGRTIDYRNKKDLSFLRKDVQIVFQDPNTTFNPRRTLLTSLQEGLVNKGIGKAERMKKIKELTDIIGISFTNLAKYPHQFSGGQKQRLSIARALLMEPELLILDEPVSSLDVSVQAQIINLLMNLRKEFGLTYLFISHDLHLVGYVSTLISVMKNGEIVEHGEAEQILFEPKHSYTKELFASSPIIH
ncbi:MAG: ABC transporter ATP-binding protein [Sphaerochaetaceae bacterium]